MINNYEELNVGKYLEVLAVDKTEGLEEIDKQVKIVAILSGMSEEEILHISIGEYEMLARQTDFLRIPRNDEDEVKVRDEYEAGGLTLCPVKDFRKLETGQYIDFKAYATKLEDYFVQFLSVILVPKGHRYGEGYEMDEVQKAIREMPMSDAMSVVAFFLASFKGLIADTLNSSEQEVMKIKNPEQKKRLLMEIARARALL